MYGALAIEACSISEVIRQFSLCAVEVGTAREPVRHKPGRQSAFIIGHIGFAARLEEQINQRSKTTVNMHASVTVDRDELLRFFDEVPQGSKGHATAMCAVAGEDLGAGLLKRYLCTTAGIEDVSILRGPTTMGTQKGSRLDRWMRVQYSDGHTVFYQVEIKNWSAHAIGGKRLALDVEPEALAEFKRIAWTGLWDVEQQAPRSEGLAKVLTAMKCPVDGATVEPVACLWRAVHPEGGSSPWFDVSTERECFPVLHVFSMSAYLRQLTDRQIDIEMPDTISRLHWINRLFPSLSIPV